MHNAAQVGFTLQATAYNTGRPGYPPALRGWLEQALGITEGATVIDLGAGTGKLTHLLNPTASIMAVEPVAAMRAEFSRHFPQVPLFDGTAERIPLDAGCADALVCGQAFHWFANKAALREIHRVLTPGGQLGLIWNVRDESVDWVAAITDIITPYEGDAPRFHTGQWRAPFDGELFSEAPETRFAYTHRGPSQAVIMDRFMSVSFIAALPEAKKAEVARQLSALIHEHPALKGQAKIAFPYETRAYRFCREG